MNRRTLAVAAVVALMTASTHAADSARSQDTAETLPRAERPLELRALFHRAPGVVIHNENGYMTGPSQADVIVARLDENGKLVKACVDSEEAARRFLNAPIEKVAGRKATER